MLGEGGCGVGWCGVWCCIVVDGTPHPRFSRIIAGHHHPLPRLLLLALPDPASLPQLDSDAVPVEDVPYSVAEGDAEADGEGDAEASLSVLGERLVAVGFRREAATVRVRAWERRVGSFFRAEIGAPLREGAEEGMSGAARLARTDTGE